MWIMHAYISIRMDIYIYYLFSSVLSSVHISVYRSRGVQSAASRQIESLPVVLVLMKRIGAWLLGV